MTYQYAELENIRWEHTGVDRGAEAATERTEDVAFHCQGCRDKQQQARQFLERVGRGGERDSRNQARDDRNEQGDERVAVRDGVASNCGDELVALRPVAAHHLGDLGFDAREPRTPVSGLLRHHCSHQRRLRRRVGPAAGSGSAASPSRREAATNVPQRCT